MGLPATTALEVYAAMKESVEQYTARRRALVNEALQRLIGDTVEWPAHLHRAIRYSLFAEGKRLHPILVIAGYEALASVPDLSSVLPVAASTELLHIFTLIHDDLPSLDDDDTREGMPTSHRVHGEALAILAGDALQSMAFQVLTDRKLYPMGVDSSALLDIARDMALAIGEEGVVGELSMDLGYEGDVKAAEQLAFLYAKRTSGLVRTAVLSGARLAGASPSELKALSTFGDRLGLALQFMIDLQRESIVNESSRSKPRAMPSIVELIGIRATRDWGKKVLEEALQAIVSLDERADPLRDIARWVSTREV